MKNSSHTANPLVSVVVTHYNEPKEFLRECLDSIVAQTITAFEAIIVDDGSDARSALDVQSLSDLRITLIRNDHNRGLGAASNLGVRPVQIARPLYFYRRHSSARSVTNTMYNSHARAESVYQRHRTAFEVLGSECPSCKSQNRGAAFRALGYLTSSIVSLQKGERWRAVRMAFRGFTLQPKNPQTQRQLLRTLLPRFRR